MRKSVIFIIGFALLLVSCNPDYKKAMEYKEQGDWTNAQESMLKVVEANPKNANYHNELGFIYEKRRYLELAEKEYATAANLDPYYVDAHYNSGSVRYRMKKYEQAKQSFETVLKLNPNNAKAINNLALIIHIYEGNHQLALEQYQKAINLEPENPVFYENLCRLYKDMGQEAKAVENCKRAASLKSRPNQ